MNERLKKAINSCYQFSEPQIKSLCRFCEDLRRVSPYIFDPAPPSQAPPPPVAAAAGDDGVQSVGSLFDRVMNKHAMKGVNT